MSEHRLDKIVIERPRHGWRINSHKKIRRAIKQNLQQIKYNYQDEEISSLKPCYKIQERIFKTKSFSDHLSPLFNWLRSKQGQHWDVVYAELSRLLKFNTLSGQHILAHVWQFVEKDVVMIDNIPYHKSSWYRGGLRQLGKGWRDEMYVHPETGILTLVKRLPKPKPKQKRDLIWLSSDRQYRKINGIWYLVYFQDVPEPFVTKTGHIYPTKVRDIILKETITFNKPFDPKNHPRYAYYKSQCNKKEIQWIEEKIRQNSNI
jgi:hypothetical protein